MRDPLFEPIRIRGMEVKNRICMPAMHMKMCRDFEVTEPLVEFYAERARGGAGMIIVGFATVDEYSGNVTNIGAHRDEFIPGLTRLAQAIQGGGALAVAQINHAGRYNFSFFLEGKQAVAPSAVSSRMTGETPRAITIEEIEQTIESFGAAALRIQAAGYDAVEVLCGTGYLISEFLLPLTNWMADLVDVNPQGIRQWISSGHLKAAHRAVDPNRSRPYLPIHPMQDSVPVPPGEVIEYAIAMMPTSNVFRKGHSIELIIRNQDDLLSRLGTWGVYMSPFMQTVTHTIHFGKSHLLVPVIPA